MLPAHPTVTRSRTHVANRREIVHVCRLEHSPATHRCRRQRCELKFTHSAVQETARTRMERGRMRPTSIAFALRFSTPLKTHKYHSRLMIQSIFFHAHSSLHARPAGWPAGWPAVRAVSSLRNRLGLKISISPRQLTDERHRRIESTSTRDWREYSSGGTACNTV